MIFAVRVVIIVTGLAWSTIALAAEPSGERPAALGSGRVVLVPLNLAVRAVAEVAPGLAPVWRELLQYCASVAGPVVALEREGAGSLWNEVMAEMKEEVDRGDLYAAYGRFARRVAEQAEVDRIVFPTVLTRAARVSGRVAEWDGVRRPVEVPGRPNESIDTFPQGKIWLNRHGAQGELAAASLHIAVLSADGQLRFQGTGGLVLLQELSTPKEREGLELSVVMRKDPFTDAASLRHGIAAAFR
jgi:hypothetical protein